MKHLELERRRKCERVAISEDTGIKDEPIAVILYVPRISESDHDHIELSINNIREIHKWLGEFLEKHDK